jgi:hypothetical protein
MPTFLGALKTKIDKPIRKEKIKFFKFFKRQTINRGGDKEFLGGCVLLQ